MEETNNTEVPSSKKSPHVIAGTLLLLVLVILLFITLKPADKVAAPVLDDDMGEMQDTATTTPSATDTAAGTSTGNTITTNEKGEQVIVGDGFTATVRPVITETPIIKEFTVRTSATGETCFFKWDVSKAQKCNLMSGAVTGVSNIGATGSIQIGEGTYRLRCDGLGGGRVESEPLSCVTEN